MFAKLKSILFLNPHQLRGDVNPDIALTSLIE
ncbi:hypothetical protein BH09ACT9_BH09ACT9_46510 [soil metagenome]